MYSPLIVILPRPCIVVKITVVSMVISISFLLGWYHWWVCQNDSKLYFRDDKVAVRMQLWQDYTIVLIVLSPNNALSGQFVKLVFLPVLTSVCSPRFMYDWLVIDSVCCSGVQKKLNKYYVFWFGYDIMKMDYRFFVLRLCVAVFTLNYFVVCKQMVLEIYPNLLSPFLSCNDEEVVTLLHT